MSAEPKETSQWAMEACDKLRFVAYNFSCVGLPVIQHAINQACAERDAEIARLKEDLASDAYEKAILEHLQQIAQLKEQLAELKDAYLLAMKIGLQQKEEIARLKDQLHP